MYYKTLITFIALAFMIINANTSHAGDADAALGIVGATLGTYAIVDSQDNGFLDDSSSRADRFIYNNIPKGSNDIEINNLFLKSLNPIKEHYEVFYIDPSGVKRCFKVEESGIIRSKYKKSPCL